MPNWSDVWAATGDLRAASSKTASKLPPLRGWSDFASTATFTRPHVEEGKFSLRLWRNTEYYQANYLGAALLGLCFDAYQRPGRVLTLMLVLTLSVGLWRGTPAHVRPHFLRTGLGHLLTAWRRAVQLLAATIGPATAKGSSKAEPAAYAAAVALLLVLLTALVGGLQLGLSWLALGALLCLGHASTRSPNTSSKVEFVAKAVGAKSRTPFAALWEPLCARGGGTAA